MLVFATLCYALLCFALLCYALLRSASLCIAMLLFALLGLATLGYAWLWDIWLCFPLLCFDFEAGPSPCAGRAGKCEKRTLLRQQFDPNREFLEKMPFSTPFVGGTTAGPEK